MKRKHHYPKLGTIAEIWAAICAVVFLGMILDTMILATHYANSEPQHFTGPCDRPD